jgi:hypothetical protein
LSSKEVSTPLEEQTVYCYVCGEEFEYKFAFAEEHIKNILYTEVIEQKRKKIIKWFYCSDNRKDKPIVGYQIFHNYIREHQALGKTPAAEVGINVEGDNKRLTLIQCETNRK